MIKPLQKLCFIILISNFSFAQVQKIERDSFKYFDEDYKPLSKLDFERKRWGNRLLSVEGDSVNHRILFAREKNGKINNRKALDLRLAIAANRTIESTKPLVIIFYPGKDPCNSSGTATRRSYKKWYNQMEKGIRKVTESTILYFYKKNEGLSKRNNRDRVWVKDPESILEKLFFKHHYPCSSFVVISASGDFISYFGEFSKDYVWKAIRILTKE